MNLIMMMIVDTQNVFLNLMMMKMMDVQDGNSFSSSMPAMYDENEHIWINHLLDDDIMFAIEDNYPFLDHNHLFIIFIET